MNVSKASIKVFSLLVLSTVCITEHSIMAAEIVKMRSLQKGPLLDGILYSNMNTDSFEFTFNQITASGISKTRTKKVESSAKTNTFKLGYYSQINPHTGFTTFLDINQNSFELNGTLDYVAKWKTTYATTEFGGGPVLKIHDLSLGGYVSALKIGNITREQLDSFGNPLTQRSNAPLIPLMRIFAAVSKETYKIGMGVKVFNQALLEYEGSNSLGVPVRYDSYFRSPGKFWLDAQFTITETLKFGVDFAVVTTGQASGMLDESNIDLATDTNGETVRNLSTERRNKNHAELGFGGVYQAASDLAFTSSVQFVQASYAKDEYASLEDQNTGGTAINVGVINSSDLLEFNIEAGYLIPNEVKYTASTPYATPWATSGESVQTQVSRWHFGFSVLLPF